MPVRLLAALLAALLSVLVAGAQPPAASRGPLTLATYAYATNDRVANLEPLARHLAERLGREVRVASFPTPEALNRALADGVADVALTNTFGYLLLAATPRPAAVPVAAMCLPAGVSSGYRSMLVVRAADGAPSLDALVRTAGRRSLALVSSGSTTGNLLPRLALGAAGMPAAESAFATVRYAGTHAAALADVRERRADVAGVATEEFDRLPADAPARRALRPIWTSRDVPLGPAVVRAALPAAEREAVARVLLAVHAEAPAAFAAVRAAWVEARLADRFAPVDDAAYDEVRREYGGAAVFARILGAAPGR